MQIICKGNRSLNSYQLRLNSIFYWAEDRVGQANILTYWLKLKENHAINLAGLKTFCNKILPLWLQFDPCIYSRDFFFPALFSFLSVTVNCSIRGPSAS